MFGFIVSVVSTLGAFALAILLLVVNKAEAKRDPLEGMGFWEAVNGKAYRAMRDHAEQQDTQRNWAIGLICWAIASAIFAVARGVELFGG
ncbi:MAG: hypothetical protein SV966_00155 [Actinomycetota bacterium]|nr:hypothetical protein [Actinomycetota bacterium]